VKVEHAAQKIKIHGPTLYFFSCEKKRENKTQVPTPQFIFSLHLHSLIPSYPGHFHQRFININTFIFSIFPTFVIFTPTFRIAPPTSHPRRIIIRKQQPQQSNLLNIEVGSEGSGRHLNLWVVETNFSLKFHV